MPLEIFAGPIVRKVSSSKIYIWIATINSPAVSVKIMYKGQELGEGYSETISLKDALYIHLIGVSPGKGGPFPVGELLHYAIGLPSGNTHSYEEFNTNIIQEKIAYANESWYTLEGHIQNTLAGKKPNLPGFFIPSDSRKLNISFGSCRKPHDDGKDAFENLDTLLNDTFANYDSRPHVLYLGGDQIYADDVEQEGLLPAILNLCKQYNITERLPGGATDTVSIMDRSGLLKAIPFTSSALTTHLLSFGEFVAMYGLVWNVQNWKGQKSNSKKLTEFIQGLPGVRRVLANTPTYMIFDDHDVTDDWFINGKWKADVLTKPAGKRIIANAMANYFLFQGWGNAPEKFNFSAIKTLIEDQVQTAAGGAFDNYFLNLNWEFAAPTIPVSYFLDTRTQRAGHGFPVILKSGWSGTTIGVQNKNMPFVLVAPAPMVTFPGIDSIQTFGAKLFATPYTGGHGADFESWGSNPVNYISFFDKCRLDSFSKIVIISGDVHYGFSAIFSLYNKAYLLNASGKHRVDCLQLTSSAMKNSAGPLRYLDSVPYPGKLYYLIFADKKMVLASEKRVADNLPKTGVAAQGPAFCVDGLSVYERKVGFPMGNIFYTPLTHDKYPELVLELIIKSSIPQTSNYIPEHNFGLVSIMQNSVEYSFNRGTKYTCSL